MTKNELIKAIAREHSDLSQKQIREVLEAALDKIVEGVVTEGKVSFIGFGTFSARLRKSRTGRNPQTGEALELPESIVPGFKPGKVFKAQVREMDKNNIVK